MHKKVLSDVPYLTETFKAVTLTLLMFFLLINSNYNNGNGIFSGKLIFIL